MQRSERCHLSHIHTRTHPRACTHTQIAGGVSRSEWASDTPLGPLPRCQLRPPCSLDLVPAQRTEKQLPRLGCGSSLSCILGLLPPPEHLGGARDQGNSWAPTSERKRNRRNPHPPPPALGAKPPPRSCWIHRGRAECWLTPPLGTQHSLRAGTSPWTAQGPQTCWGIRSGLGVQVTGSHQIPNQALEILYKICLQGSFSIQKAWLGGDTRLKYCPRMGWAGRSLLSPSISRKPLRTTEFWKRSERVTGKLCCPLRCHEHCLDSLGLQPTFPAPS